MSLNISIITVNFNNLDGLKRTITSVLDQTYANIEYIVIDGGSLDGSKAYIESCQLDLSYWISESDEGIYNAMNKGIDKANGEYLLFLNSGDLLSRSTILDEFLTHPKFHGDIIYGDYIFKNGGKQYTDSLTPLYFMKTSLPHQSTLFHKSVFQKMGLYDESYKICADRHFYLKCFLSTKFRFARVPVGLTLFDLSGVSNNTEYLNLKIQEDERLFKENYGIYYEDYKEMILLQEQLNDTRRKTLTGILKRVKNKIKFICHIR